MGVLDNVINFFTSKEETKIPKKSASHTGSFRTLHTWSYDGEKNLGAIGPVVDYYLDYESLRSRSWKAYLDSEVAQTILGKFSLWNIGSGLKLQSEPAKRVLKSEKINIDIQEFNEDVEARFSLFCDSTDSDHSGMRNIHQLARKAHLHSLIGGDLLVILRYENDNVTVQLIDGSNVCSPFASVAYISETNGNIGNTIQHGIETDKNGKHIAYYVRTGVLTSERVLARSTESGLSMAFLICGLEYRLDNLRGIPLLAAVMQTIAQMDRYKEATIGAAEESAKIVYTVEHEKGTGEENILAAELRRARGVAEEDIPEDSEGEKIANKVAATTHKQTYNMPEGAQLKAFNSQKELYFKDFYSVNINLVCSTVGIPPDVAMSMFNGSYSSSRAAIKDWEHTLNVGRKEFSFQFYVKLYAFWLDIEILKNNIQAPGYLTARLSGKKIILDAYRNARFVGASVPHIDPLKEVQASRLKLGDTSNSIPLSTVERETEVLNSGSSDENIEQYAEELKESKNLGVKIETPVKPQSV